MPTFYANLRVDPSVAPTLQGQRDIAMEHIRSQLEQRGVKAEITFLFENDSGALQIDCPDVEDSSPLTLADIQEATASHPLIADILSDEEYGSSVRFMAADVDSLEDE